MAGLPAAKFTAFYDKAASEADKFDEQAGPRTANRRKAMSEPIAQDFVEFLRCPIGHSPLVAEADGLVCRCGARFAVRDGIPNLVIEEAQLPEGITEVEELAASCPDRTQSANP